MRQTTFKIENHEQEYSSYSESISYRDSRTKWLKSFKFDIDDAKAQLLYFEERMADRNIIDDTEIYYVVREF